MPDTTLDAVTKSLLNRNITQAELNDVQVTLRRFAGEQIRENNAVLTEVIGCTEPIYRRLSPGSEFERLYGFGA